MPETFIDNPVLNSPFKEPDRHFELDETGNPTGVIKDGRRPSIYLVPVPPPKKRTRGAVQAELALGVGGEERVTENPLINLIRGHVEKWRQSPPSKWNVTHETQRLLEHWRDTTREQPLFFCQVEAAETIIWLTEAAPKTAAKNIRDDIQRANAEANPELFRLAMKMATGSGKTMVMAMLIAWHVINKARQRNSKTFSDAFLIVTPGITIRDRLRVLLPSDPQNYYETRDIVPRDMLDDVRKAEIVITNYHALMLREKMKAPKLTKEILKGRKKEFTSTETEGEMVARVCREIKTGRDIIVINDEAHHCYRHKIEDPEEEKLTGDERKEAEKREKAARVWISGIEAVKTIRGVKTVFDLSATPFFLRGSGYKEGRLFPWVVSDFSLMDAIESGIVKVPRVPVSDDQVGGLLPVYRDLWKHIGKKLPKKGRAKQKHQARGLDPDDLPPELEGAMQALYEHYAKVFELWRKEGVGTPPVFIIVCNNTSVSKLVYDYLSGYEREEDDVTRLVPGKLPLFSNVEDERWLHRPRTLLIDSEQLDSGEAMSAEFKKMAVREIEEFKRDLTLRFGSGAAEDVTDEDLLREVMNTVGKPGKLGEHVRCVVSVSMLTEGWDANTVTHILGIRAFGTQLLCEQVVGRGLRRVSYDADDEGKFEAEYADVLGVPFTFVASHAVAAPKPPKPQFHVFAVPERKHLEMRFPRIVGYRVSLPAERLKARFTADSKLIISPDDAPTRTQNEGIVGEGTTLTIDEIKKERLSTVAFHVAGHALRTRFRDDDGNRKPYLFPQLLKITRAWLDGGYLVCKGNTAPQWLLWRYFADLAVERIYNAVAGATEGEERLRPIIDSYNPWGSSEYVDFQTTKTTLWKTSPHKSHVNYVVCDSDWEANFCETMEAMPEVLCYVKNHGLGFEVPYVYKGDERRYFPDFIVAIEDKRPGLLNLIVEIKGFRGRDAQAKADTMKSLWVPVANNHGGIGRWSFIEIRDIYEAEGIIRKFLVERRKKQAA